MQRITDIAPATIDEQHRPNKAQADSPNIKCSFRLLKLKQMWRNKCKIHTKNTHIGFHVDLSRGKICGKPLTYHYITYIDHGESAANYKTTNTTNNSHRY